MTQPQVRSRAKRGGNNVHGTPNFANRTLYHGDNLPYLQSINSKSVHLIYADPPFNKNKDFHSDPESIRAAGNKAGFTDRWKWEKDVQEIWVDRIKDDHPGVWQAVTAARTISGDDMAAFLCWLSVRLIEMHRILRDDGCLYLHLDHTAHAYAKTVLDAIFGKGNFRNSIAWNRNDGRGKGSQYASRKWGANTDTILFYAKGNGVRIRPVRALTEDEIEKEFSQVDDEGRRFKWGIPVKLQKDQARPTMAYVWRGFPAPPFGWRLSRERMDEEYAKGNIVIDTNRKGERRIRRRKFLDEYDGKPVDDFWADIPRLVGGDKNKESVDYPTQKPLKLLHRIIETSTNRGDFVLDPFAGCATTPIAAEQLGRQWLGADIWKGAHEQVLKRLSSEGLAVPDEEWSHKDRQIRFSEVIFTRKLLVRTDDDNIAVEPFRLRVQRELESWQRLTHAEMRKQLIYAQTLKDENGLVTCAGCGRQMEHQFFHLDHIQPKKGRGRNYIDNRILLCAPCNGRKGYTYTLEGLQDLNSKPADDEGAWMFDRARAESAMTSAYNQTAGIADGAVDLQR